MKAIVVKPGEKAPHLVWGEVPEVRFGPGEVLVEVRATAVNRADLLQARGLYPPPAGASEILGLEMSGVIAAVGGAVRGWRTGDRVMALLEGGGYAQRAAVNADLLMRLPQNWSFEQGAAAPEAWLTAFVNLLVEGGLVEGQSVLIHAGASGVGTAAIQMARAAGANVYATAGTEAKLDTCRELGARAAIDYKKMDFAADILARTAGRGVDLVLDPVGASHLKRNLQVLAPGGRVVHIGLMGGSRAEIDLGVVLGKSLRLIGSRLRPRPLAEKIEITRQFERRFRPLVASGRLSPIIDRVFPIEQAEAAHARLRENLNIGKVVLKIA
ncbi:MAG: NAD(P)H-quinone oxidoreductase [Desulfobacterales bacterium]|jgi:putative PIG3 family NAD(P)H quinone oxidoreductase|nr:NAD(P)H-quinone oxidoreductase [Desulfobacterales bacterium]